MFFFWRHEQILLFLTTSCWLSRQNHNFVSKLEIVVNGTHKCICCHMANSSKWRHFPQMIPSGYIRGQQIKVIFKQKVWCRDLFTVIIQVSSQLFLTFLYFVFEAGKKSSPSKCWSLRNSPKTRRFTLSADYCIRTWQSHFKTTQKRRTRSGVRSL